MAKDKENKPAETETKKTETAEQPTKPTAEECKDMILQMSSDECKIFNVMVFNNIDLYNIVMGGVKNELIES